MADNVEELLRQLAQAQAEQRMAMEPPAALTPASQLPEAMAMEKDLGVFSPENIRIQTGLLFSRSDQDRKDIVQKALPNAKFRFDDQTGATIVQHNGKEYVLNKPGLSPQDLVSFVADVGMFSGMLGGAPLNAARSTVGKIATGAGIAATTEAGVQAGLTGLGGTVSPAERALDVAAAGGLQAAGEFLSPVVAGVGASLKRPADWASDFMSQYLPKEQLIASAKELPIEQQFGQLTPAQRASVMNSDPMIQAQTFLMGSPQGSAPAFKNLRQQDQDAAYAVQKLIANVAENYTGGSKQMIEAAGKGVEAARAARSAATSPLFEKAFSNNPIVYPDNVVSKFDSLIEQQGPDLPIRNSLEAWKTKFLAQGGNAKFVYDFKKAMRADIEKLQAAGDRGTANELKRYMTDIDNTIRGELVTQVPGFEEAITKYREMSPAVDAVKEGLVGDVAKLDPNSASVTDVVRKMFGDNADLTQLKRAKTVIKNADPEAWDAVVKSELMRRAGKLSTDVAAGEIGNSPNAIKRAIFGNSTNMKAIVEASDGDTKKNLLALHDWLSKAELGRNVGSQTGQRAVMSEKVRESTGSVLSDFFSSPVKSLGGELKDIREADRLEALANIVIDPKYAKEMADIRKTGPYQGAVKMADLLKRSLMDVISVRALTAYAQGARGD